MLAKRLIDFSAGGRVPCGHGAAAGGAGARPAADAPLFSVVVLGLLIHFYLDISIRSALSCLTRGIPLRELCSRSRLEWNEMRCCRLHSTPASLSIILQWQYIFVDPFESIGSRSRRPFFRNEYTVCPSVCPSVVRPPKWSDVLEAVRF